MKDTRVKKGVMVGIILLFVGTCIIPAIAQETEKPLPTSRGNWLSGIDPNKYRVDSIVGTPNSCKKVIDNNQQKSSILNSADIVWDKTFGGRLFDEGEFARQTNDGGYIFCGVTCSYATHGDNDDAWLIKTDIYGDELWNKTYGGNGRDGFFCVQQTTDGGYILTGYTSSFGAGSFDVWFTKVDDDGTLEWEKTFGGTNSDYGVFVQQTSDGGYIIVGRTEKYSSSEDMWLLKTDPQGNLLWDKAFNVGSYEYGYCVQQTRDGGYILVGDIFGWGYPESTIAGWVIKTDTDGDIQWDKKLWYGTGDCKSKSVNQTSDGGYIVVGCTACFGIGLDAWLIKLDANGSEVWNRTYGVEHADEAYSVQQTNDGGYIFTGEAGSDLRLVKTDSIGNIEWDRRIDGGGNGLSVQQVSDGGYLIGGYTMFYGGGYFDFYLIKTDENGNLNTSNHRPVKPMTPTGPTHVRLGIQYTYSTSTADIDGDMVYYWFDWDDNTTSGWIGPFSSGETVSTSHRWTKGSEWGYKIQVKAKDEHGRESAWSDYLGVGKPLDAISGDTFLLNQLRQSSNTLPFLRQLLIQIDHLFFFLSFDSHKNMS